MVRVGTDDGIFTFLDQISCKFEIHIGSLQTAVSLRLDAGEQHKKNN